MHSNSHPQLPTCLVAQNCARVARSVDELQEASDGARRSMRLRMRGGWLGRWWKPAPEVGVVTVEMRLRLLEARAASHDTRARNARADRT